MYQGFDASSGPPTAHDILSAVGFLGHVLRLRAGGRGGQQFVLFTLAKRDGKMGQKELFKCCSTTSAALSEVLSKLEAEGLIERTTCTHDRRQLDVKLTEAGWTRAKEIVHDREQFETETLSCMTQEEQMEFMRLLDKVARHWNELEEGSATRRCRENKESEVSG